MNIKAVVTDKNRRHVKVMIASSNDGVTYATNGFLTFTHEEFEYFRKLIGGKDESRAQQDRIADDN